MLLVLPSLAGCLENSTRWDAEPPKIAVVDKAVRVPCKGVTDIPDKALSEAEASNLWATDRERLGACKAKNAVLSGSIAAIEGQGQ